MMADLGGSGIVLEAVSVTLAGRPALRGISLDLREARIGIVGRNGSGKTTLLRVISGLIAPDAGRVLVAGVDPARDRKAMLRQIGILFQNPDHQIIFPTVIEEMAFGLRQQGLSTVAAQAAARAFLVAEGRGHWADVSVQALSQGQRQYLCLMSILAMQPRRLLLDEPFAGLDLPVQIRLRRRLEMVDAQVVTITHDPKVLEGCTRAIWLEAGIVRMDGEAAAVAVAFAAEMTRLGADDADLDLPL